MISCRILRNTKRVSRFTLSEQIKHSKEEEGVEEREGKERESDTSLGERLQLNGLGSDFGALIWSS